MYRRIALFFLILFLFPIIAMAGDKPVWSTPKNLSGWLPIASGPGLEQNDNGTVVVFWIQGKGVPPYQFAFMARVKSPSGSWGGTENITGFSPASSGASLSQVKVAPDGTVWLARVEADSSNFVVRAYQRESSGNWQPFTFSSPVAEIRGMDLHIGPDGDIGLIWVECDTAGLPYAQGSCRTLTRRRAAKSIYWTSKEPLDTSSNGLALPSLRVGPNGMMVATWARFETTPNWRIKGKYCPSPTTSWHATANVSQAVEPFYANEVWGSAPVMGADGTFVIAWFHKTGSNFIIKSSTRMAASSTWTPETVISGAYPLLGMEAPRLAVGQDGTVAAVWKRMESGTGKYAAYANVRDAGGVWAFTEMQLSGWMDYTGISDLAVFPDGRAIVIWKGQDDGKLPKNEAVFWAHRSKSGWWNSAQVSSWNYAINGSALAGINNDSAFVVWIEDDFSLPAAEAYSVHTTGCFFSTPTCSPPAVLADGYKMAGLYDGSVHFSTIKPSASVSWLGARDSTDSIFSTQFGMFFSQWPKPFPWTLFYPAMTGAGR